MSNNRFGFDERVPETIRDIFMWLCQDVAALRLKWSFYTDLFSSKESTDLLSDLAPASFKIIEEALRADMTMSICRLSDPIRSKGQQNLSFKTLVCVLDDKADLIEIINCFVDACEPVRDLRNKNVGHSDFDTKIKPEDNPLPGIKRSQIEEIIQQAEKILNSLYCQYTEGELSFKPIHVGGADALLHWLRKGWETELDERKAMLKGAA